MIEKVTVELLIKMLEAKLQKSLSNQSLVNQAIAALKKGLDGVLTLAEPVASMTMLGAKVLVGMP